MPISTNLFPGPLNSHWEPTAHCNHPEVRAIIEMLQIVPRCMNHYILYTCDVREIYDKNPAVLHYYAYRIVSWADAFDHLHRHYFVNMEIQVEKIYIMFNAINSS